MNEFQSDLLKAIKSGSLDEVTAVLSTKMPQALAKKEAKRLLKGA